MGEAGLKAGARPRRGRHRVLGAGVADGVALQGDLRVRAERANLAEADLVLCEGYKASLLPKVEIHRAAVHKAPLWEAGNERSATWRAMVSDVAVADYEGRLFDLGTANWLEELTTWVEEEMMA